MKGLQLLIFSCISLESSLSVFFIFAYLLSSLYTCLLTSVVPTHYTSTSQLFLRVFHSCHSTFTALPCPVLPHTAFIHGHVSPYTLSRILSYTLGRILPYPPRYSLRHSTVRTMRTSRIKSSPYAPQYSGIGVVRNLDLPQGLPPFSEPEILSRMRKLEEKMKIVGRYLQEKVPVEAV